MSCYDVVKKHYTCGRRVHWSGLERSMKQTGMLDNFPLLRGLPLQHPGQIGEAASLRGMIFLMTGSSIAIVVTRDPSERIDTAVSGPRNNLVSRNPQLRPRRRGAR